MDSNFEIGEVVVCVNAKGKWYKLGGLKKHEIYTVVGFNPFDGGLILNEVKSRWSGHKAYRATRFRKVDYAFAEKIFVAIKPETQEEIQLNGKSRLAVVCKIKI